MLAFCAYWEGKVRENPNEFDRYVSEVHLPLVAKYPNLRKLLYLKGETKGGLTPKYYQSFELYLTRGKSLKWLRIPLSVLRQWRMRRTRGDV